ncbi:MAG TPA: glutamate racemase [Pseudomonadales bacterium]
MLNKQAPVGVFDSGVGGLSILSGIHDLLPGENLQYVADSAHAPYGTKSEAFIRGRCETIMQFLLRLDVKAVVVACNTATAAAVAQLRDRYELPIIGVEPAIKPAAELSKSGVVGVLATSGTIASEKFVNLQNRFVSRAKILTRACTGLVELIEQVEPNPFTLDRMLHEFIRPLTDAGADTLVLGCTHYSLIKPQIQKAAGPDVRVVDAGAAVAKELQRRLVMHGLVNDSGRGSFVHFHTSGKPEQQNRLLAHYWGKPVHAGLLE